MNELSTQENQELLDEYLKRIDNIPMVESKKPFVVVMTGLPGSGKSTFAAALSEKLGLYIARNDDVRRFLNDKGFDGASPLQSTVEFINLAVTNEFFARKISHIRDADMIKFHTEIAERAARMGMELVTVRVVCDDQTLLQRIEERERTIDTGAGDTNQSLAGREILNERKKLYESIEHPQYDFVFDSTTDVTQGVIDFLQLLRDRDIIS